MAEIIEPNPSREIEPLTKNQLESVRSKVEQGLYFFGGWSDGACIKYCGKMSTLSYRVGKDINGNLLEGNCGEFSRELERCLTFVGLKTQISVSVLYPQAFEHIYLTIKSGNKEFIIDPTLGQFIDGYNHVFVGEREEIHKLVTKPTPGGIYRCRSSYQRVLDFFERTWGSSSKPLL